MPRRTIVNYAAVNITENLTAKVTSKASSSSFLSSEAFFNFIARSIFFWQSANRQGSINLSGPDGLTGFDGRRRDEMFQTTHLDVWWTVDPINGLKTPAATLKNLSEWNCNSFFCRNWKWFYHLVTLYQRLSLTRPSLRSTDIQTHLCRVPGSQALA